MIMVDKPAYRGSPMRATNARGIRAAVHSGPGIGTTNMIEGGAPS